MQIPQWLNTSDYPFAAHTFSLPEGQMHFVDEGKGVPLVCVHGTPSWSYLYRNLILGLRQEMRVLAPDHLGFGLSDKPSGIDYRVEAQARRFALWVEQLELPPFHLVVHDFGGPIALAYALQNPHKIRSLTISNTWLWSSRGEAEFEKMAKSLRSPLLPFLYRWLNFSARFLLPMGFATKQNLSRKLHRQYLGPFARRREREGPLGLAKSLWEAQDWFAELWQQRDRLGSIPSQIIWGEQDRFFGPAYRDRFAGIWQGEARVASYPGAGHFVWEEAPEAIRETFDFIRAH